MSGRLKSVDFLLIGAARSATTSLSTILAGHPEISFSNPKEPQFFSDPGWRKRTAHYHSLFEDDGKLWGEGSTNYSKFPAFNEHIHQDIYAYNPDIKILYMLRHPVDRLVSHYRFAIERGLTSNTLEEEVQFNPIYINASKYFTQIQPYIDLFGRENVHLILFEDFKDEPENVMNKVWNFLGLDSAQNLSSDLHLNKSGEGRIGHIKYDKPKGCTGKIGKFFHFARRFTGLRHPEFHLDMSDNLRLRLEQEFSSEIDGIEKLTGRDLSHWR